MKRNGISLLAVAALVLLMVSACGRTATVSELSVVPEPVFMVQKEGSYTLHSSLKMSVTGIGQNSPTLKYVMKALRSAVQSLIRFPRIYWNRCSGRPGSA